MPKQVRAFGQVLSFPDDMTDDAMAKAIRDNEHLLNPDYKEPSGFSGMTEGIVRGAKQTGRMVGAAIDTLTGNLSGVEKYADESATAMQRDTPVEQKALLRELSAIDREQGEMGKIGDALSAAKRNPMGTGQFIVEQTPNTAVSLGAGYAGFKTGAAAGAFVGPMGAAIGGTLGFMSGMFLGNYLLESGNKAIEKAGDEDGFTLQDRDAAIKEGAIKSGAVTVVDALTFKLGGAITQLLGRSAINAGAKAEAAVLMKAGVDMSSPVTINAALKSSPELFKAARIAGERASLQSLSRTKKAGIIGTGLVAETLGEGVGEYVGEYAATGKPDAVDATMESLAGLTQSSIQAAYNFNKLKAGNDLSPEGIHKVASSINEHDVKEGVSKINTANSVDEAIAAANDVVSQKPTTKDDVLRAADPTLADIERLTGLKPTEAIDQAIAEAQQQASGIPQKEINGSIAGAHSAPNLENSRNKTPGISDIVLPDGTTLQAQWDVVDADSVSASIKEGVNQPRDRTRIASDIQIQGIASNPDYRRLSDSPVMDVGAPVLSHDNLIVGGNGRFEGISQAYNQGTEEAYLRTLIADAESKGIDRAVIQGMKKPVLVRRITQPFDTRKLAIASNSGGGLQYSGLELAKIDAERMSGIEDLDITDSGDIALTASNFGKLRQTLGDYNPTELAAFTDDSGSLSQDGVRRIRNAILAKAYGKSDTLGRLVESTDTNMRNVLGALTKSASAVAKAKANIAAGAAPKEIDVTDNLLQAVETFSQIRSKGQPLENYLAQQSLFGDGIDADSKEILQFLHDNVRSQKRLTGFINEVYDQISAIDQSTDNIFGDNAQPTKRELIENAKQRTAEGQQQPDIFQTAGADNKAGQSNEQQSKTKADNVGSGEKSQQDAGLKFSRSPEERLKDRERSRQLEKLLNQKYKFTITPKDVRLGAAANGRGQEAATAERIARIFGKRVTWIEAKGDFPINGVMVPGIKDTIFVDVTTKEYAHAVIGHELSHHMEYDAPKAYRDMVEALMPIIKDADAYQAAKDLDDLSKENVIKEIVGDIMGDNFTDPAFWDKVANHNPNAFRKIADAVITWLKRLVENAKIRSLGSEQWVTDAKKAQDIVAEAVAKYTYTESSFDGLKNKAMFQKAWHGSPHDHNKFDSSKIGTGEGAQAYGYGHYFAGSKEVAEYYKEKLAVGENYVDGLLLNTDNPRHYLAYILNQSSGNIDEARSDIKTTISRGGSKGIKEVAAAALDLLERGDRPALEYKKPSGKLYEVELAPSEDEYLLWDKPLSEQSEKVKAAFKHFGVPDNAMTGKEIYSYMKEVAADESGETGTSPSFYNGFSEAASKKLHSLGIRGIKYLDGTSRSKGEGSYNYVIFDEKDIEITAKFSRRNTFEKAQGSLFGDNSGLTSQEEIQKQVSARSGNLFDDSENSAPATSATFATQQKESKPTVASVAATSHPKNDESSAKEINDFGEKLGGARKDMANAMRKEYSDDDIASLPLGKIWPSSEVDAIEDKYVAAVAFVARAEIPSKPRTSYKVASWVEKVKLLRTLTSFILDGKLTKEQFKEKIQSVGSLRNIVSKIDLLERIDRSHWKRIDSVAEYPNAIKYGTDGAKIPSPQVSVYIDGRYNKFGGNGTVASVIDEINSVLNKEQSPATEKRMQFEVRGREGNLFINKKGDREYRKLKTFTSIKEAFGYIKNNYDELVEAWEAVKESDNVKKSDVRREDNRARAGQNWRNDKDVTPEQFGSQFGFRGVEFGNWVSQGGNVKERQGMLNEAYDALMDLANIVGIPPKAISLNGSLGLGFGSRGKGWASAHFEPDMLVINLTKTRGAGSLAHEWFHALDNYFQRSRGEITGNNREDYYVTYKPERLFIRKDGKWPGRKYTKLKLEEMANYFGGKDFVKEEWTPDPAHPLGVRPEVEARFTDLVNELNKSPMTERAKMIDKGATDGYWSRIIERAARSFENYVIAKMMRNGYHNDYLANVVSPEDFSRDKGRYPYLLESEIAPVAEAFDNLFSEIKYKETDKGVALFSRAAKGESIPETINIDGVDRPTRNSEGKLIHPAEEGIRNFWRWFGDSKVVDEQGRPKVVYHGTKSDINKFINKKSSISGAFFFSENRDVAGSGAFTGSLNGGGNVIPVYLKISNPSIKLDMTDNPMFESSVIAKAKENGSDGIGVTKDKRWIAFNPNQIKSATGNTGAFSESSGDIRFSRAENNKETITLYHVTDKEDFVLSAGNAKDIKSGGVGEFYLTADPGAWMDTFGRKNVIPFIVNKNEIATKWPSREDLRDYGVDNGYLELKEIKRPNGEAVIGLNGEPLIAPVETEKFFALPFSGIVDPLRGGSGDRALGYQYLKDKGFVGYESEYSRDGHEVIIFDMSGIERSGGGAKFSFAGKRSETADEHQLNTAQQRLNSGEDAETVRQETGWFKGVDGKWRYEIDDSNAAINMRGLSWGESTDLERGNSTTAILGKFLEHPALFAAYPDLENTVVRIVPGKKGASYDSDGELITVGYDRKNNEINLSSLLHEIQHGIQNREGFARGGSPESSQGIEIQGQLQEVRKRKAALDIDPYAIQNKKAAGWNIDEVDLKKYAEWEKLRTIEDGLLGGMLSPYEAYRRLAGEVEARNTQSRVRMTEDERKATSPQSTQDVADSDVIVMFNGHVMDNAPRPNNAQKSILSDNQPGAAVDSATTEGDSPSRADDLGIPKETRFREFQREWQDDFNRFTVLKEWLASRGINLSEKADVFLAEERFHAKVANQKEDFRDFVVNPLIERIAKAGFKMTDIADYLEAQHAKEANAQIRRLHDTNDPEVTAYGISDEDAADYLEKAPEELGKLANEFRAIAEQTKRLRLDGGLLNTDITDAWESTYKHYIPVKGLQEQQKGTGKGLSVNFKTKRRLGHGRRDEAVIENILHDHERAIFEVEKNRVAKHLAMMAAEIGMPELMTIGQPEKRQVLRNTTAYEVQVKGVTTAVFDTREAAQTYKSTLPLIDKKITADEVVINPTTDQRIVASASPMLADNEINAYIDGHAIRIQINDEIAARAYKKLGIDGYGKLVAAGRALNGYLSKVYTGYNPEFIMVNLVRDFTTGVINLTGEEGLMMAAKAIKNYPGTFASLLKYAVSNSKKSNKWIDMYRSTGGNTGAAYLSDMERLGNDVATEYAAYQGVLANLKEGKPVFAARAAGRKVFNVFLKWIYNMNQAGENAMRLAAFKAMIESGRTKNEAAHIAKNITVNFNRKGENGATANAAWLFFNASVQGQSAMFHALFKGKHKGQAWALVSGMVTLGYLVASALGGGDEDDYDKIDDYTKERNLVMKHGDGWLKIPVPYGYGFFYNLGRSMADAQRKDELGLLPWHISASAIEELTPFGDVVVGSDEQFKMDQIFMGMLPTALKIPGQVATNKQTFSGGEIMPESPFDKSQPDREKMWRGTKGTIYDELAGYLQMAGMDVSPETLKYSFRTGTGGAGALVDTAISAGMLKAEGAELEPNEMPFLRKIYQENTIKNDRAAFHKARQEAQTAAEELARAVKRNDLITAKKLTEDKGEIIALDNYADKLQKTTRMWRDEQDRVRTDKNMSAGEKRLKLKELEAQEAKLYDQFLEIFKVKKAELKGKADE